MQHTIYGWDTMRTQRLSFVVDKDTEKEFRRIMSHFSTGNKNQTFIWLVKEFRRILFEAQLYRRLVKDVKPHESLWDSTDDTQMTECNVCQDPDGR
ncbi:MAG: hypothetical protein HXS52_06840 [Theionarchaea archaeon]|nr:hypothetical protein [Theionarchaea archaeon]